MSPSKASNDDFPRPIGAENFDVWKTRVCVALDGKHLLGYVKKVDYDGVSENESEDSRSDMSDVDVDPKSAKPADVDSDAIDYEESDDELKPPSGSDEDSGDESDTSIKRKDLPEIRPFNRRQVGQERKRVPKVKPQPLNQRERRHQEAKTKAFLMKTMDNTHVRLVKNLYTSYEIFTFICEKYEGAAFHGDPFFIQHYLMEIKYEEGSDLTEFFLKLENATKAASEATESGRRKYIPYEDLKQSIEGKVRAIQAQEGYTLSKGTPKSNATKKERALMANGPPAPRTEYDNNVCSYCNRPRHNIRFCRGLQKDLRDGRVKAGTVLPANFAFKGNSKRDHPYRNTKSRNRGRNGENNNEKKDKRNNDGGRNGRNGNRDKSRRYDQRKKRGCASDGDDSDSSDKRKVYRQERHETGLIAVATTINPPLSPNWFSDISASGGSITVSGKNQIPIEGVGRVELDVIHSKGNSKTLTLHGVLYAPKLKFSLLSIPAGVKHDFRFNFDLKLCAMQTDQRVNVKAPLACDTDLYQF
ncbi:Hypothetical protein PHPALM_17011 [Phytophthora palmivora]|uniref:Retrovirus-related Pol polyprotein from transposon TNT 1-94-like beta-barrel domain-containing protein n=1 Tax=Phytophthora palmivora TaxID=4796 RepID=A0A2P4XNB4_9STRA|nr:Hypothetical protein PHPALM_17011 [Phytophthora palmivora]